MSDQRVTYEISLRDLYTKVANKMDESTLRLEKRIGRVEKKGVQMGRTMQRVGGMVAAAFSVGAIVNFANKTEEASDKMLRLEQRFRAGFGSFEKGNKELEYSGKVANDLGIDLLSATEGYSKFAIAAKGTKLEGQGAREVFEGISVAAAGAGLSADQVSGAVMALEQMLSKGKVQAEELRGQLGERIPGAFRLAAEAMNMTTGELDKFMSDGKLLADDFLPRFAQTLKKEYGAAAAEFSKSDLANKQKQMNEQFRIQAEIGKELIPVMYAVRQASLAALQVINSGIKIYKENATAINFVVTAVGGAIIALGALKAAQAVSVWWSSTATSAMLIQAVATGNLTGAQWLLNAALTANPIGLVVAAIGVLVAGIVYAWNNFEGFRQVVFGLWETFKQVFDNISGYFKKVFSPVIEAIEAFRRGDWSGVASAVGKQMLNLTPIGLAANAVQYQREGGFTNGVGAAYQRGVDRSIARDKAGSKEESPLDSMAGKSGSLDLSGSSASGSAMGTKLEKTSSKVQAKQPQNIYINIDTLGDIKLTANTFKESEAEMKRRLQALLLSVVNDVKLSV
jgi:tape measure domain-containing protein